MNSIFALVVASPGYLAGVFGQQVLAFGFIAGEGTLDHVKGGIRGADFFDFDLLALRATCNPERSV